MFVLLGFIDKSLHQSHQFLLCDVFTAEAFLEGHAALVQSAGPNEAGDVHNTAWSTCKRIQNMTFPFNSCSYKKCFDISAYVQPELSYDQFYSRTSSFNEWQEVCQHISGGKEVSLEGFLCLDRKWGCVCH